MRALAFAAVCFLSACGGAQHFELTTNAGQPTSLSARATVSGSVTRTLQVCGDFPVILGATDTGGSACVNVELDPTQLAAGTFTVAGQTALAGDGTRAYSASATNSAAVKSAWFSLNCFCALLTDETINGTLTLHAADSKRLAGELSITIVSPSQTNVVHASFDVSG